ncbi:MAG TPA: methyltransferase domain-containing protein [Terriglobales bacterium]|jgi:SAM-dependent methyltransferase|nr:methyltransferase domain-containing protein [Terriglobales bacterium]
MTSQAWPKVVPPLTPEQTAISNDFMRYWHEVLPRQYGLVDHFNHRYPVKRAPRGFLRTLEIGAGLGTHLEYERLTPEQECNYVALELRENMAMRIRQRFQRVQACVGDCQAQLPFADGYFDRILAIHVLEHLPNLPAAVREMRRLCQSERGVFSVVIPCEGGLAYGLARRISAQRLFEKRYGQSYAWFIEREHLNQPHEILDELNRHFEIIHRAWFPLGVPSVELNLCIGLTLRPKTAGAETQRSA